MCFRPAGVEIDLNCPSCGKKLPVIGNTVLKKCPFCKYEFTEQDMQDFQAQLGGVPPVLLLLALPLPPVLLAPPRLPALPRLLACKHFCSLLRSFAREN